jgi:hypothetical protein
VVLGSPQRTTEVGPLAAARLRDAVAAELDRTRLRASARWRLA